MFKHTDDGFFVDAEELSTSVGGTRVFVHVNTTVFMFVAFPDLKEISQTLKNKL